MSQKFKDDGTVIPVTHIQAGPCIVTDIRTVEKDGYQAVQVGYGKTRKVAKPQLGRSKTFGPVAMTKECRVENIEDVKCGDEITVEVFTEGDVIDVTGTSKGKGFAGVVKRHGFAGQSTTHGTKDQVRSSGSIGAQGPQRVIKGVRMAGRMGGRQITVKNLEIVSIDKKTGQVVVKGAIPGAYGSIVYIKGCDDKNVWK